MSQFSPYPTRSLKLALLAGILMGTVAEAAVASATAVEENPDAIAPLNSSPSPSFAPQNAPLQQGKHSQKTLLGDNTVEELNLGKLQEETLLGEEGTDIQKRVEAENPSLSETSLLSHPEWEGLSTSAKTTPKESQPALTSQIPLPVIPPPTPLNPPLDRNNPPPTFDPIIPQTFGPNTPIPPTSPSPPTFEFDNLPPASDADDRFSRYRLGIGDNISVRVENFPEFDVQGTINLEGNLVVPILGNVPLIGLTLEEVSAKISTALGQQFLFEQPEVTTVLVNPRPATITVLGEVVRPGFYNLVPGAEVDEAIVAAQGSTNLADLRQVIVRRSLAGGSVLEREVNIFESLQNGTRLPLLRLQDGDSVFVPRLQVGQDEDYDRRLVAESTIAQPQIIVRVLSYPNEAIGSIALANGSTFVDAISQIGLSFQEADLDSIGLLRFDPEQGQIVSQSLNALAAIEGDFSQNVPLQDEDILVVRRSTFGKIDYILRTVSRPINSVVNLFEFIRNTLIDTIPNLIR
ncbi:MAG: polysaccharide biosynthesis/export family protein [Cyanobacteriota bacterium]|nr:polysaccharide biosynthesis/export family protein [Cyanobacteriota bacterium]